MACPIVCEVGAEAQGRRGQAGAEPRRVRAVGEDVGEVRVGDDYVQRVKLTDTSPGVRGYAVVTQRWDFGDGNSATGSSVEHVYLKDGDYKVMLTIASAAHHFSVTNTVHITRNRERQIRPAAD